MPKLRSHSGAKKRFLKTGSGKFKYQRAGRRHLLSPRSGEQKQHTRTRAFLNRTESKTMEKFLPYA